MEIISHRGLWQFEDEKNSIPSFIKSFEAGFGTELDVRDFAGELVISHDVPSASSIPFCLVLKLLND